MKLEIMLSTRNQNFFYEIKKFDRFFVHVQDCSSNELAHQVSKNKMQSTVEVLSYKNNLWCQEIFRIFQVNLEAISALNL